VEGIVVSAGGQNRHIAVDTLCLHGDSPGAVENARAVRSALEAAGVKLGALA
jgi:UPF0271 protein